MTQIYVVCKQGDFMSNNLLTPDIAYSDYPSALAHAQSIFKPYLGDMLTPRDLVFMVNLTPTATSPTTPTTTGATP